MNTTSKTLLLIVLYLVSVSSTHSHFALAYANIAQESDFYPADKKYNIDYRLLYSLAQIESGGNRFAIGAYSKQNVFVSRAMQMLKNTEITFRHHHTTYISIYPSDEEQFRRAFAIVKSNRLAYDVGVMQISSGNIDRFSWKIDDLIKTDYNIERGASILRGCFDRSNDVYMALECYNKGFRDKYSWSHSNKVVKQYKRLYKKDTRSKK